MELDTSITVEHRGQTFTASVVARHTQTDFVKVTQEANKRSKEGKGRKYFPDIKNEKEYEDELKTVHALCKTAVSENSAVAESETKDNKGDKSKK